MEGSDEKGILGRGTVFQSNRKFGVAEVQGIRKGKGSSKNGK